MDLFKIHPEVISIHVPKTAGSTFHNLLQQEYGWRLKHIQTHKDMHQWNNGLPYLSNKPFVKAIHGHIEAHPAWKSQYPEAKIIAWLRDPVERVISAYYHWKRNMDHKDHRHEAFVKINPTLIEFVEMLEFKPTAHAFQTFLGRLQPEDYYFLGRTENFQKDMYKLRQKLGWKDIHIEKRNVNPLKEVVAPAENEKLRSLMKEEYELYRSLLVQNQQY